MKLLQRTGRYYLWFSAIIFLLGVGILYFSMKYVIGVETDKRLQEAKAGLKVQLSDYDSLPASLFVLEDVVNITPLYTYVPYEKLSDTEHLNPIDKELEPYRKYTYHDEINGKPYKIELFHSTLDNDEMIISIVLTVLGILGLFLLVINLFNRYMSLHLWKPFYQTVQQIKSFNFEAQKPLSAPPTNIDEFATLQQAIEQMTAKLLSDYRSLKQFSENASHEIQTPLAIIKSKIELLMQAEGRNESETVALHQIQNAASRLSKLNQSLLLLTRIENHQYSDKQELDLKSQIEYKLDQLEPLISSKNIEVHKKLTNVQQSMNPTLLEVLLNNLIGNAIKHNHPNGKIEVTLQQKLLTIRNTGAPLGVAPNDLFERFRKGTDASPSLGLGLAIVKEICTRYNFEINYDYRDKWHGLSIFF